MWRRTPRSTNVGYAPRGWGRLAVLLVMLVLIVFLAIRARDPRAWAWLVANKPLPQEQTPAAGPKQLGERKSIDPDRDKLKGAADREPFLLENPDALVHNELWTRQRRDADARYELLLYAKTSEPGSLFADAFDVRYLDLMTRPQEFRGEVIHIRGDLLWIRQMDLKRPGLGMKTCYQALMTVQHPERAYWLLFTDLPPGLSAEQDWGALYLPNVEFAGYFYKILAVEPLQGKKEPRYLPVLVGQSLKLPPAKSPTEDLPLLLGLFLAATVPVALIGLTAWWMYRRGDRQLREKMAQVRQRTEARDAEAVARLAMPDAVGPEPHHNGSVEPPATTE